MTDEPLHDPSHGEPSRVSGRVTGAEAADGGPARPTFPRYLRILAVAHALSHAVGPAGFFVLMIVAVVLALGRGAFDGWVLGVGLAALACPALCAAFRLWFERWGARRFRTPDA